QLLDFGQQRDDFAGIFLGDGELHGRGIERFCRRDADEVVDGRRDALRGGEVGIAQRESQVRQTVEREVDLALDDRTVRDAADSRYAARDLCGVAFGRKAADCERALP